MVQFLLCMDALCLLLSFRLQLLLQLPISIGKAFLLRVYLLLVLASLVLV